MARPIAQCLPDEAPRVGSPFVTSGLENAQDAINEAIGLVTNVDRPFILFARCRHAPYDDRARSAQTVIGREARAQMLDRPENYRTRFWPGRWWFERQSAFSIICGDPGVELIGVEAAVTH